jgi:hypothetical protein
MNTEPSRSAVSFSRWSKPYVWLTAAAIAIIILNIINVIGFIRGFLLLPNLLLQQYFEGGLVSENTRLQFDVLFVSVIVPVVVSAAGASLLFLKKPLVGTCVAFGAIATHFIMDAIYISYVWDGHHVIQSYTHAAWLVRSIQEYGGYTESIYAFNLFYIPIMTFTAICLLKGWKRIGRFPTG